MSDHRSLLADNGWIAGALWMTADTVDSLRDVRSRVSFQNEVQAKEHDGQQSDSNWWGGFEIPSQDTMTMLYGTGWSEGASKALALADGIRESLDLLSPRARRVGVWSSDGDDLSLDRWQNGSDKPWRSTQRLIGRGPRTVSIGAEWMHNAMASQDDMFWSGAALIALADLLEASNHRVELSLWHASDNPLSNGKGCAVASVNIKNASEPLQPDMIAAIACHAGVTRYLALTTIESFPAELDGGHGRTTSKDDWRSTPAVRSFFTDWPDIFIPRITSEAKAIEEITKAITTLNGMGT